MTKGQVTGA